MHRLFNRFTSFFSAPIPTLPLGVFRITIGAFGLLQAGLLFGDWANFFGPEGYVQWEISQAFNQPWHVHLADVYQWISFSGMTPETLVWVFFWTYLISLVMLVLGWRTRIWAILTWAAHYVMLSSLPTFTYGVDIFYHIALFYLMVMPVGNSLSLDVRSGRRSSSPTWSTTLAIRVLQVHLCLIYLSAGFEKMLYEHWWAGNVLWRSIVQPDFSQYNMEWLAWYPAIPMVLSWFTMIIETFYFVGMWVKNLRVFWLLGIVGLHVGIGIFIGLWLFGLVAICLSVSAFGPDCLADVRRWRRQWLNRKRPWEERPQGYEFS